MASTTTVPLLEGAAPSADAPESDVYTPELQVKLTTRMQQARGYVWMHSRCGRWATFYSVIVAVVQCLASYAAGCLGVTSQLASLTPLMYVGTAFSFAVGAVTTLAKLKYANFEAVAEQHSASVSAWNALWADVEAQLDLPPARREPAVDFVKRVNLQFATLESTSEGQLPLWVRREWAAAAPSGNVLPDMCYDATVQLSAFARV